MILRVTSCSSTSSVIVRVCVRVHVCYELGQSGVCSLSLGSPQNSSTLHSVENTHSFSCCQNALSSSSMPNSWDCSWQACLPPWCWRCTPELCRGPLGPSSTWWTAVLANTASRWSGGTYVCGMLLGDGKKDVFPFQKLKCCYDGSLFSFLLDGNTKVWLRLKNSDLINTNLFLCLL